MTETDSFNPKRKIGENTGTPITSIPREAMEYLDAETGDRLEFEPIGDGEVKISVVGDDN